jgi:hypothetical protein
MRRLGSFIAEEEEAVAVDQKQCRHGMDAITNPTRLELTVLESLEALGLLTGYTHKSTRH